LYRRTLLIETLVVAALFSSAMYHPATTGAGSAHVRAEAAWTDLYFIVRYTAFGAIALFIAWISGDPLAHFGIRKQNWTTTLINTLLLGAVMAAIALLAGLMTARGANWAGTPPPESLTLAFIYTALRAITLQFIIFGFLFARLKDLTKNLLAAAVISVLLYAQIADGLRTGPGLVTTLFALGFGIASVVSRIASRSIWPSMIAYALYMVAMQIYALQFSR